MKRRDIITLGTALSLPGIDSPAAAAALLDSHKTAGGLFRDFLRHLTATPLPTRSYFCSAAITKLMRVLATDTHGYTHVVNKGDSYPPQKFTRIATEEAFVTHELLNEYGKIMSRGAAGTDRYFLEYLLGNTDLGNRVRPLLLDLTQQRIAAMKQHGVSRHVLSVTSPGVQLLDPDLGAAMSIAINDQLYDTVQKHPDRFSALATIAPQAPAAAVREIQRCSARGFNGIIINGHTNDEYLDEPKYYSILEAAAHLGMPIYLHPRAPVAGMIAPFLKNRIQNAVWGYGLDTSTHAVNLILSGIFDRLPNLIVILGHLGEGIPFWFYRLDFMEGARRGPNMQSKPKPSETFLRNFRITTSGQNWEEGLQFCIRVVGIQNIMWAIDYPYQTHKDAQEFMDGVALDDADKRKIYSENAERIFRIKQPEKGQIWLGDESRVVRA